MSQVGNIVRLASLAHDSATVRQFPDRCGYAVQLDKYTIARIEVKVC